MTDLRLDTDFVDYAILATYFLVVLGVGFAAKRVHPLEPGLLPVRPLAAGVDHRPRVHLRQPRRARGDRHVGQRRPVRRRDGQLLLDRRDPGDGLPRPRDDAVLLRLEDPLGAGVPAAALQRPGAQVQLGHLRGRDRADRRREPLRAGPGARAAARLAAARRHRRRRRDRHGLHQPRRPVVGDLQRGAPVLRDRRGAAADRDHRPRRRRRLERADRRHQGEHASARPACTRSRARSPAT